MDHYLERCNKLWSELSRSGHATLVLDDEAWKPFEQALQAAQEFFSQTKQAKLAAYTAVPGEGYARRSSKELHAVRRGSSVGASPGLTQASVASDGLAREFLQDISRSASLRLHPTTLASLLEDSFLLPSQPSCSVLRCSLYDSVGASPSPSAGLLAYAPHHDRGVLTLVVSSDERGLQVARRLPQGPGGEPEWEDVPLGPGRVAVLAGYSLSYALGGVVAPVLHRVHPEAGARGRLSLAYELCCRPAAVVDPEAVMREAACRPAGPVGRPLSVSELMELFEVTHPLSINGVPRAGAQQQNPPGPIQQQQQQQQQQQGPTGAAGPACGAAPASGAAAPARIEPHIDPDVRASASVAASAADPAAAPSRQQALQPAGGPSQGQRRKRPPSEGAGSVQAPAEGVLTRSRRRLTTAQDPAPAAAAGSGPQGVGPQPRQLPHEQADGGARDAGREHQQQPQGQQPGQQPQQQPEQHAAGNRKFLQLIFMSATGEVHFKVKLGTRIGRVVDGYENRKGLPPGYCRYFVGGERLRGFDETVEELGLEDGDTIDVITEQVGN